LEELNTNGSYPTAGSKKKANEAEKKLTEAQALSKKLKEETVAFRSRIEELEKQKREIDGECDSISNELAGVKKRAEETEKALKEKEAEALRMKGQIYDAMVEIENLKMSNAEIALLKSQVDLRDRALVSLQDERNKNNREWEDICNELLKKCEAHGIMRLFIMKWLCTRRLCLLLCLKLCYSF
jgi:chromosome segregation ATPase